MGITLFEAIAGKHPFENAHTKMQLILKHLQSLLPSIRQYRENTPFTIDTVLEIATAKDPKDRYASITALAEAFRDAWIDTNSASNTTPAHRYYQHNAKLGVHLGMVVSRHVPACLP
jgi:serine/threonine protein kinase